MSKPPRWQEPLERALRNPELSRGIFCDQCQYALTKDGTLDALMYHKDCLDRLTDHLTAPPSNEKGGEK